MAYKTTDLYDKYGEELQVCEPMFSDYGGNLSFEGEVVTVKCFEDNSKIKEALAEPGKGKVLVADAGGSLRCAVLGDMIAGKAVEQEWAGIIIYGSIRDSEEIAALPIGVKALATIPRKSIRRDEGQRDIVVTFGGVSFAPGDYVYCDADGILIADAPLKL